MRARLGIEGMHAVHAVRAVHTALTPIAGIVRVDVRMGSAVIDHDGRVTCEQLRGAIDAAGYRVQNCVQEPRALPTLE